MSPGHDHHDHGHDHGHDHDHHHGQDHGHDHGHDHDHGHHDHDHDHDHDHGHHGHGHHYDRGWRGALRYLRHSRRMWQTPVNRAVADLVDAGSGQRIVDIGAGLGPGTVLAAQRSADVLAVEPTPFLRSVLRLRCLLSRARRRVTVVDGAAESVPATTGTVDTVSSVNTMHHWTDPAAAARELHRILRPGGRVILVDEDFDDPRHEMHEQTRRRRQREGGHDDHPMHMVDVDAMAAHFRAAGFVDVAPSVVDVAGQPCRRVMATKAPDDPAPG